jgi:hypothetical protein
MKRIGILFVAFAFSHCFLVRAKAQDEPALSSHIIEYLRVKEPGWRPVAAVQSLRVPLVPSETRILTPF